MAQGYTATQVLGSRPACAPMVRSPERTGGVRTTITDALGETTVDVEQARFGEAIEDGVFAPGEGKR